MRICAWPEMPVGAIHNLARRGARALPRRRAGAPTSPPSPRRGTPLRSAVGPAARYHKRRGRRPHPNGPPPPPRTGVKAALETTALVLLLSITAIQALGFLGVGVDRHLYASLMVLQATALFGLGAALR